MDETLHREEWIRRMKPLVIALLAAAATCAWAQSESAEVEKALLAAPDNMKKDATVVMWKSDFTYETLKKGTNRMVCYDLSGKPGQRTPFAVECTSIANLDRVAQNLKFNAISDKADQKEAFDKAEKDGTRVKPEFGSLWIHLMGADAEHTRKHITVAVPGATTQSLGLPESGKDGDLWIMNAGTTTAHLMIPGN
jgi:hypothetical protein